MDLNVKGVYNATRAACECMIARGDGVILNTSSMVSIYGQPSGIAYPASKFAVNGLTVSLARELGPKGIRVNAVAPGVTETDMMKSVPKEVLEPIINQIPILKRLIGSTNAAVERTEVLVLITGYIVNEHSEIDTLIRRYNDAIKALHHYDKGLGDKPDAHKHRGVLFSNEEFWK